MIMDNEKLILLVKQNDMLYNKGNPLFKHPDKKREVWQEIAEEMGVSGKYKDFCILSYAVVEKIRNYVIRTVTAILDIREHIRRLSILGL